MSLAPILSITGSDNSGQSGLQLDLHTVIEMGGHALTSATCIVMPGDGENCVYDFPLDIVQQQVEGMVNAFHPKAIKVGLVRSPEVVHMIRDEVVGCQRLVVAPGFLSSGGMQLISDEAIHATFKWLVPEATLLVLRCREAERMLGITISTDEEMVRAAQMLIAAGARYVLLRGGKVIEGRLTALLASYDPDEKVQFFTSRNIEGWQQHGVGGALSAAITARLGMGDSVPEAIRKAHDYVHSRIVYAVNDEGRRLRSADIYETFINLLSAHYQKAHDVAYYANRLSITTRYLSQITDQRVGKSPKQIIADCLMVEARRLLENTRISIKEISTKLGFSAPSSFCKFFSQQAHCTPSEYRLSVESL